MRRVFWFAVIVAAAISLWWVYAATNLQREINTWFAARVEEGWQAEAVDVSVDGFPRDLILKIDDLALADPETGVALQMPGVQASAPVWRPGEVSFALPDDEISFATTSGKTKLTTMQAGGHLHLRSGAALVLENLAFSSQRWALAAPEGSLWGAEGLDMDIAQDPENPTRYRVEFDAPSFQPGSVPRRAFRVPADWPVAFDSLTLNLTVDFDRPIDRSTIEVARPGIRALTLDLAEAAWGRLLIRASADLEISQDGRATGDISLQARNWRDMLSLAEAAGSLPSVMRPQLENILAALARGSGNPNAIDVTLSIADGRVFLGFIPLGELPPLLLP